MSRLAVFLVLLIAVPALGQQEKVDERRVEEILQYVELRSRAECDVAFEALGDYPRAIQLQKMRSEIRPWDGELATDLIWMLGNVDDEGGAIAYAIRYRMANPDDPDHGLAEAQVYWEYRMFSRIPRVLEDDIKKDWPMHRNVFVLLSNAYARMGFHKDVVRVLDIALQRFPGDEVFLRNKQRSEGLLKG